MPLDPVLESFRDRLTREQGSGDYEQVETLQAPDACGAEMSVRFHVGKKSYYEVRVDRESGELQAGFGTESRVVNEAVEEMILDNGGDLDDLLHDELADLGAEAVPMEHFFERPQFRFIVRLPLTGDDALADPEIVTRTCTILKACRILFQDEVDEA